MEGGTPPFCKDWDMTTFGGASTTGIGVAATFGSVANALKQAQLEEARASIGSVPDRNPTSFDAERAAATAQAKKADESRRVRQDLEESLREQMVQMTLAQMDIRIYKHDGS